MKHFLFISLCLVFLSCEKYFHPEETLIAKLENYGEWVSATEGVYARLAQAFNSADLNGDLPNAKGFYAANIKGDDMNFGFPWYDEYYGEEDDINCYQNNYNLNNYYNSFIHDTWQTLFHTITTANNIIIQYKNREIENSLINEILGEVYLIRAYCYFRLTRTYGKIPLVDDIETKYHLPKSSFKDIYEFIEQDLKKAMQVLPKNNTSARIPYVTAHRGTAKAILAEVYLSWAGYPLNDAAKYTEAAREAGEVIDSAGYFGFGLMHDFAYLWDMEHRYNSESVFTLYFANPLISSVYIETNLVYSGLRYHENRALSHNVFMPNPETRLWLFFFSSEINFYNYYPPSYRKEITFYSNIYVPNEFPYYPVIDTGYIDIDNIGPCSRPGYRKFFLESQQVPYSQYHSDTNLIFSNQDYYFGNQKVYLFRYAHTLLTYAESAARSGQLDQKAYECMNRVRRRAHKVNLNTSSLYDLQPGLSPEVFADSVVWERAWELCGEPEGRWFDLLRLELVENLSEIRHPEEGGPPDYPITKQDYYFSTPPHDDDLNPNLDK